MARNYWAWGVAPLAGAWIETQLNPMLRLVPGSRPSRARGLKRKIRKAFDVLALVAPLAGAWIETCLRRAEIASSRVAPLAGAWIETHKTLITLNWRAVAPLAG